MNIDPKKLGAALALSRYHKTPADFNKAAGFVEVVEKNELFCRGLCKLASAIYEADGAGNSLMGVAFKKLADNRTPWKPGYQVFTDSVLRAVGRTGLNMEKKALITEAIMAPSMVKDLDVSSPMRMALAAGILTGAAGGAGVHLLGRGTRQSSEENEELLEKAREYRRLRQEIDEDIANSGVVEDAKDTRHAL